MNFELTEEQRILVEGLGRLVARDYEFSRRQAFVRSGAGRSAATWQAFAEMGLLALPYDEADGGFDSGATGLMAVMQELGRGLVLEPILSSLLCGRLIAKTGDIGQRESLLPRILDGSSIPAFAHLEDGCRHPLERIETLATAIPGGGHVLTGRKVLVDDASAAGVFLVLARTGGTPEARDGIGLFLVDAGAAGIDATPYRAIDDRRIADLVFDGVRVDATARLAHATTLDVVDEALDFARTLICCEAVGVLRAVNEMTIEYLKTRRQFGVPIGSFQALQHRVTEMAGFIEQAYSLALLACAGVDADPADPPGSAHRIRAVAAAKIKVAEACRAVGQAAVQLHGGMGMAQEMKVSHAFKRLTVIERQFGDVDYHLGRFAAAATR
ncbi:MAG: acyl-CoA dehydrogenase family protein [Lautropia sp.]